MTKTKLQWISTFRNIGDYTLAGLEKTKKSRNDKASEINKCIKEYRDQQIEHIETIAKTEGWGNQTLLNEVLMLTYASYIVMLEYRNKVWEYEYMAFARRVGELWEPFCKLAFVFPVKSLSIIDPPNFNDVQTRIKRRNSDSIRVLCGIVCFWRGCC